MPALTRVAHLIAAAGLAAACAVVPLAAASRAHAADGHPARIQHGACDNLGGVAFQLTGVGAAATPDGTPTPPREVIGAADAHPVQISETTLATSLSQLTQEPHAIVVYESDEAMDHVIACGAIGGVLSAQMGGMVMPGDVLTFWLPGEGDGDIAGVAQIEANGTEAMVRLILAEQEPEPGAAGEPDAAATPAAG